MLLLAVVLSLIIGLLLLNFLFEEFLSLSLLLICSLWKRTCPVFAHGLVVAVALTSWLWSTRLPLETTKHLKNSKNNYHF